SRPPELMLQFGLGALQPMALGLRQGLAGAVDVEGQHRERGAVGPSLAAGAVLRGALQRSRDLLRIGQREDAALEVERIALFGDALRPALCRSGFCRTLFGGRRFLRRRPPAGGTLRNLPTLRHRHPQLPLSQVKTALNTPGSLPATPEPAARASVTSASAITALAIFRLENLGTGCSEVFLIGCFRWICSRHKAVRRSETPRRRCGRTILRRKTAGSSKPISRHGSMRCVGAAFTPAS